MTLQAVESTSPAGGRGPEQPVPSYYALGVGDIDVVVISDGVLPMPAPALATNADPDVRAAWLDDMFLPSDSLALPLNQVVVRRGDQTILIDAGVGVDHPDWFNGFEHDPEEAARVRVRLLQELSSTREALVATHLPFPSVCHVATAGNAFRCVPAVWES
ncbi:hypothetical protein OS121_01005 [Mycolicibacterium mucogenicum]|uniref:hypothetical protein n=1 Tax=Mycolicibacterium mucogenicum TaxID=56689 RepID=UPI0022699F15|nr:hypothetical protein [Mycolicibacterium mucogenicum]MCX8553678.1 hypothetical protein [Mycolicibacterium mucogenicum]